MSAEAKLRELGIQLKDVQVGDRPLIPWVLTGNLLYTSGSGPSFSGKKWSGQLGTDYTAEEGYEAARDTALQLLSTVRTALGSLDRVRRVVKVLGMVNSAPGFSRYFETMPRIVFLYRRGYTPDEIAAEMPFLSSGYGVETVLAIVADAIARRVNRAA